jgi:hypothetical protein
VLQEHYQRASAAKYSMEIEDAIEDQILSTPTTKKTQESIRQILNGEDSGEEDEIQSEVEESEVEVDEVETEESQVEVDEIESDIEADEIEENIPAIEVVETGIESGKIICLFLNSYQNLRNICNFRKNITN